ncbi:hypothetical protein RFM68_09385 [Mesorhizobium sp. MSK_1335]|uniref:Uncharacterized protein n=1 Tax=Mesorhizobium montanum TaxID=3072323 RepID=A0ABU4ZHA9_9HYPH|nr:hypothetical protein [Mesorhizobium sp. MSK_1335]MDX8524720.1 hypothetical protein [Mesorhizobium sp. MSK_1335]
MSVAVLRLSRHAAALSIASIALFLVMTTLEFFYFQRLSGGLASLDIRVAGFTPDDGMAWLTALGRRGGEIIIVWHYLTFDLLFPALLSLTLVSLILAFGRRLSTFRAMPVQVQALFSLVLVLPYTIADYAQNLAVARLLSDFQSANPDSLAFASFLTVTKFALLAIPFFVIAVFALAGQRRR